MFVAIDVECAVRRGHGLERDDVLVWVEWINLPVRENHVCFEGRSKLFVEADAEIFLAIVHQQFDGQDRGVAVVMVHNVFIFDALQRESVPWTVVLRREMSSWASHNVLMAVEGVQSCIMLRRGVFRGQLLFLLFLVAVERELISELLQQRSGRLLLVRDVNIASGIIGDGVKFVCVVSVAPVRFVVAGWRQTKIELNSFGNIEIGLSQALQQSDGGDKRYGCRDKEHITYTASVHSSQPPASQGQNKFFCTLAFCTSTHTVLALAFCTHTKITISQATRFVTTDQVIP